MVKEKDITDVLDLKKIWRFLLVLSTLLALTKGKQIAVKECGNNNQGKSAKIIGGDFVNYGEHPWIVSVHENNYGFKHVCGGTIINEHWILTAAHCIDFPKNPRKYLIYAGLHRLSKKQYKTVQRLKVSKIIIHEEYDGRDYTNDIALMKTKTPIDIKGSKRYINGICLPNTLRDPDGTAIVSGWGHTKEDGDNSNTLMAVQVPIVPRETCNEVYDDDPEDEADAILDTMICAGTVNRDSCQNDSGGPLVQRNRRGKYTLVGVVSWGVGCGDQHHPGVYTKVAAYMDWIESNVD